MRPSPRGCTVEEVGDQDDDRPLVPARAPGLSPSTATAPRAWFAPTARSTPARPSSRLGRRTTTRPTSAGRATPTPSAEVLPGEVRRGDKPSVVILGSGPNRIGQGIEFDYCCVHAAMTVRESGRDAVMVNCNPETVSTDYDTSDRLYFEPLTAEDVLAVIEIEQPEGVIVQFGGQTPLRLARTLEEAGVKLLGTPGRRDRPGRGPRPLRRDARPARGRMPALRDSDIGGASARSRGAGRLPAPRAPLLRPRGPGDGALLLRRAARRLPEGERQGRSRAPAAARPLPRARDRGRRRRPVRRSRGQRRRDHAARRGGRRALRRLGLRDSSDEPGRADARRDSRDDPAHRPRAGRDRADQHPVRGRQPAAST